MGESGSIQGSRDLAPRAGPVLATKLCAPPVRPNPVIRNRLIERLSQGIGHRLLLVSAGAGFGKTTLLGEGMRRTRQLCAWLSLDPGDNAPVTPETNGRKLKQGMFAQVRIVTREREKATLVPKEAVVTRSGQPSVFVLREEVVQLRPVRLGLAGDGSVEVLSSLDSGEEVVVAGQNDLRDGDRARRAGEGAVL